MANLQPTAMLRLKKDYLSLKQDPIPYIAAEPSPSNFLKWHYVIKGPKNSPYQGGYYHGILKFPPEFPFKPPSIYMLTPNGRFRLNRRLCLSCSDFHPSNWNPTWSIGAILTGLLSFMVESTPTEGSMRTTFYEKQQYAKKSLVFNLKNAEFRELFPEFCKEINARLQENEAFFKSTIGTVLISGSSDANTCRTEPENMDLSESSKNKNTITNSECCRNWYYLYLNLMEVLVCLVFVLILNYVIKTLDFE